MSRFGSGPASGTGSLSLRSCAKVNLALDVLGRRPDGYHDIRSVIYEVDLFDDMEMEVAPAGQGGLVVEEGQAPQGQANLIVMAVQRVRQAVGTDLEVRCRLRKRIPMQAGLGGGSSNAAAALRGAAKLLNYKGDLTPIAASLGSDVPFFLIGGAALVEGRGERVTPVSSPTHLHMLIVQPNIGILTAWAYGELDRYEESRRSHTSGMLSALQDGGADRVAEALGNAFERAVLPAHPEIAELKNRLLRRGAKGALLSGSGSAVFGIFGSRADAEAAEAGFSDAWRASVSGTAGVTRGS